MELSVNGKNTRDIRAEHHWSATGCSAPPLWYKNGKIIIGHFSATEGGVNRLFRGIIMPAVNQPIGRLTLG
ncbi:hypothetical protein ACVN8H_24105, partial [Escherichia coli]